MAEGSAHFTANLLPMQDKVIVGHLLRQHSSAEQLDLKDQITVLDSPHGQILFDDEHRDFSLRYEIDNIAVHPWRLSLFPCTDGEPGRALIRDRIVHSVPT
jgi:hypothetical protein